jgi:hypothetical protein
LAGPPDLCAREVRQASRLRGERAKPYEGGRGAEGYLLQRFLSSCESESYLESRASTRTYEATREAAIAAFAQELAGGTADRMSAIIRWQRDWPELSFCRHREFPMNLVGKRSSRALALIVRAASAAVANRKMRLHIADRQRAMTMPSSNAPWRAAHRAEWREDDFVLADLATLQRTAAIFLTPKSPLARAPPRRHLGNI